MAKGMDFRRNSLVRLRLLALPFPYLIPTTTYKLATTARRAWPLIRTPISPLCLLLATYMYRRNPCIP